MITNTTTTDFTQVLPPQTTSHWKHQQAKSDGTIEGKRLLTATHSSGLHKAAELTADGQTDRQTELVNRQAAFLINPWPANSASWPGRKKTALFYFQLILAVMAQGLGLRNYFVSNEPRLRSKTPTRSCQSRRPLQVSPRDTAIPRMRGW